ncbi:MAG TPA: serine/threonine-protein kinase, partial [Myxococcaceae bacterium]|nr:serine/threonine-protein kinase [Myxococcaceae bacterium]
MAAQAEVESHIGHTVAKKFRIEKLIGEGGMGKVYQARILALDKPVALKVLRGSLMAEPRTVARFRREAQAASRLSHPNSINVLDFGETDSGAYYIAMEWVDGKDLHAVLTKDWPLPEARVIRLVSQVLSALSDAHAAGIIHRDLKPENIMVQQLRDEPDFVKVLDFGIAKIVDPLTEDGPLTRAGFVCGTPEYMSPEQAGGGDLDARSDLYSVGVLLYQLTTGVLPFVDPSGAVVAAKQLTELPVPPRRRRPGAMISAGMERLILKALSKDPAARPQTAEKFKDELLACTQAPAPPAFGLDAPSVEGFASLNPSAEQRRPASGPPAPPASWAKWTWTAFRGLTLLLLAAALGLGYGL